LSNDNDHRNIQAHHAAKETKKVRCLKCGENRWPSRDCVWGSERIKFQQTSIWHKMSRYHESKIHFMLCFIIQPFRCKKLYFRL
jgi:hypothetical protein